MSPKYPINPRKYDNDQTPPCLNFCLSSSKITHKTKGGHASRINKNDSLLKVDNMSTTKARISIYDDPKYCNRKSQNQKDVNVYGKKHKTKDLISNLVAPKNHKALHANRWKCVELIRPVESHFRKM